MRRVQQLASWPEVRRRQNGRICINRIPAGCACAG